ncbi:type II toxin-antitoxin system RelE/ParE family toxin [Demequina oxidasica]|uniref:type II toxin-antitoxin system RelE/ParE family toxin n=1 Tax=Demequina oxidasica TaxID=676199 RepID=UPI003F72E428
MALRKLRQVGSAGSLDDLRIPPGHRLEALKGDRIGQQSITIKDRQRICFVWTSAGAAKALTGPTIFRVTLVGQSMGASHRHRRSSPIPSRQAAHKLREKNT